MSDTLIAYADALVAALSAAFSTVTVNGQSLPVTVEWTDDASVDLSDADIARPLVWVLDVADTVETKDGICHEDFQFLVITQMKRPNATDSASAQIARDLASLSGGIRAWAKTRNAAAEIEVAGEVAVCVKAERPTARNHNDWHQNRRFFSETILTFRRY